jgi:hypothetical protein
MPEDIKKKHKESSKSIAKTVWNNIRRPKKLKIDNLSAPSTEMPKEDEPPAKKMVILFISTEPTANC